MGDEAKIAMPFNEYALSLTFTKLGEMLETLISSWFMERLNFWIMIFEEAFVGMSKYRRGKICHGSPN